jgi:uncharacterized membrane protein
MSSRATIPFKSKSSRPQRSSEYESAAQGFSLRNLPHNGSRLPQWAPLIGGSAIALLGLTRRSKLGLVLGAAGGYVAYRSATAAREAVDTFARGSVIINAPVDEVYSFWRNYENLPLFMRHLESVTDVGNGRSRWIAIGPLGSRLEWTAEIINERQDEFIAWRSLPESDINVDGFVSFGPATGDRGTLVEAMISYRPPAEKLGHAAAKLLHKDPKFLMKQDLRRFKALIEAGEIPTVEGQPHGPRSYVTGIARALNPDEPLARSTRLGDVIEHRRMAS